MHINTGTFVLEWNQLIRLSRSMSFVTDLRITELTSDNSEVKFTWYQEK